MLSIIFVTILLSRLPSAAAASLDIISPATSSVHFTSSTNPPPIPFAVNIEIDQEHFHSYVRDSAKPVTELHLVTQLDILGSDSYVEISRWKVEDVQTSMEGNLVKVLPGRRRIRCALVTDGGEEYDSTLVEFEVRDNGNGKGSDVDVSSWNSLESGVGEEGYEDYFSQVYRYKVWSSGGAMGSDSGPGSNLDLTSSVRRAIVDVLSTGRVSRIVDVPCGDMTWMGTLLPVLKSSGIRYLGMDVVGSLVEKNTEKYSDWGEMVEFRQLDLTKDELPDLFPGDLVICRHLMFHLPTWENLKIIEKLSGSGASHLMLTTYLRADENDKGFVLAMGHKVNLFRSPYCIKDPMRLVFDDEEDMYTGVWELDGEGKGGNLLGSECK